MRLPNSDGRPSPRGLAHRKRRDSARTVTSTTRGTTRACGPIASAYTPNSAKSPATRRSWACRSATTRPRTVRDRLLGSRAIGPRRHAAHERVVLRSIYQKQVELPTCDVQTLRHGVHAPHQMLGELNHVDLGRRAIGSCRPTSQSHARLHRLRAGVSPHPTAVRALRAGRNRARLPALAAGVRRCKSKQAELHRLHTCSPTCAGCGDATDQTTTCGPRISHAVRMPSRRGTRHRSTTIRRRTRRSSSVTTVFENETLLATEVGVRTSVTERRVRWTSPAFYNDFDNLQSFELDPTGTIVTFGNNVDAIGQGVEVAFDMNLTGLGESVRPTPGSPWTSKPIRELRGELRRRQGRPDPAQHRQPALILRPRRALGAELGRVLDGRAAVLRQPRLLALGRRARLASQPDLRLAIGVQNITQDQHAEAGEDIANYGSEVRRNFYASLRLSYHRAQA